MDITPELKARVFEFLNDLRDSGVVNMFGAASYIIQEFDLDRTIATKLLKEWMGFLDTE